MIPKIWEAETFEWEGRFWSVPPRQVLPKPYQKPHPPIWVASLQPATYPTGRREGHRRHGPGHKRSPQSWSPTSRPTGRT